ncbi:MAG: hypothetical protein IMW89_03920 [Ktedonobacteraceae bacterium]|nr:hypothetical protein [Ktedonobacteraceae bacterium]
MVSNNPYDESLSWIPAQGKLPAEPGAYQRQITFSQQSAYAPAPDVSFSRAQTANAVQTKVEQKKPRPAQAPQQSPRMPKAEAQSLAKRLKKYIIVTSIAAFGLLSWLVAGHLQTAATSQSTPNAANPPDATNTSASDNQSGDDSPSISNPADSGSYFDQQGGGYGFGNNGSTQGPATSSGVS